MSVAVIPVQPSYMEPFLQTALSNPSVDSDSDAGYGTPSENYSYAAVRAEEEKREAVVSVAVEEEADSDGGGTADPHLQEKIVKQVEWYFSDENLLKDSFLMKHINRNKQGYVSLKLVASLRKVKTLSKDWKVVLESLRHSNLLRLNEEETKIRRLSPAPQVDFSHAAKTLLVTEYPQQDPNLADIEQHFGRYGEIARVRLVHPGRAIPLDIKPCKAQHSSLGKELCILVEFGSEEMARSAHRRICEQQSWRDEMKVHLLGEKKPEQETREQEEKSSRLSPDGKRKSSKNKSPDSQSAKQQRAIHKENSLAAPQRLRDLTPSPRSSREVTPTKQLYQQRKLTPPSTSSSSSSSPDTHSRRRKPQGARGSPELSRRHLLRPDTWKDYSSDSGMSCGSRSASESPKITPEPSRKFFSGSSADLSWRSSEKHLHANSCVIRQPLGPDGSRGFAKNRVSTISIAVHSY